MLRKLIIVFVSGIALAVLSISAAWVVGGEKLRAAIASDNFHWTIDGEDEGPRETREFAFDPDQILTIEVPVDLKFERGVTTSMKVDAPASAISALSFEGNTLAVRDDAVLNGGVIVTIVAPSLKGLALEAPGQVRLNRLAQDSFEITASGAVDLDADGKVDTLDLRSEGAANLDLRDVLARNATVRLEGVGDADIAASGLVDVRIDGVGSVTLHRKPERLVSNISGIGTVKHNY